MPPDQCSIFVNNEKKFIHFEPKFCPYCGGNLVKTDDNEDWIPLISAMVVKGKVCEKCNTVCHVGMDLPLSNREKREVLRYYMVINHIPMREMVEYAEPLETIDSLEELAMFICDKFNAASHQVCKRLSEILERSPVSDTYRPYKC